MSAIWVVGSLNIDLVVTVDRFPEAGETLHGQSFATYPGGKGGNQAMAVARLGGAPRIVGRVGDDDGGRGYRRALLEAGADVAALETVADTPTGTALIEVDAAGRNRIVIVAGANAAWEPGAVTRALADVAAGDLVLLQLEIPFEAVREAVEAAARRGARAVLDPAPAAAIPDDVLLNLSWITPNEHEAAALTGIDTGSDSGLMAAARALAGAGCEHVVVKAAERGACYLGADGTGPTLVPTRPVSAVDTTAAGDAFNGALACALADGCEAREAVAYAVAVAALSVTAPGAQTALPTRAEVDAFLAAG